MIWSLNTVFFTLALIGVGMVFKALDETGPEKFEICDNAIDDDDDGLIDINDPDCKCPILQPISRIPNPSFEEQNCCPLNISELNCADTWIQASLPTTDYLHTCGWMGWEDFPPPLPFPDGDAVVGFRDGRVYQEDIEPTWKEYAGACLLAPLREGIPYRFEFHIGFSLYNSPPINVTFFGNADCKSLPFGQDDSQTGCPTNDTTNWIKLGSVAATGSLNWVKRTIDITPSTDIYAIAIGPECREFRRPTNSYYFFDNLILDEQRAFEFQVRPVNHPCSETFEVTLPEIGNTRYQWYKDGVALLGETSHNLIVKTGNGDYQARIENEEGCKITKVYSHTVPQLQTVLHEYICLGEHYGFDGHSISKPGTYFGEFVSRDNCDSLVELNLEVVDQTITDIHAKIFKGDFFTVGDQNVKDSGLHRIPLLSSLGCDSIVDLKLDHYKVYIPNAFSPNGDGINDYFNVSGETDLEVVKKLEVYSRWGELIYREEDLSPNRVAQGWNGQWQSKAMDHGIYIYNTIVRMKDGQERQFSGEVTLLR